uniref:Selenoprotein M n=1 Tax=Laticauda laticaudata TaxID=8630 RepID=A0A8C5SDW2_LATLA
MGCGGFVIHPSLAQPQGNFCPPLLRVMGCLLKFQLFKRISELPPPLAGIWDLVEGAHWAGGGELQGRLCVGPQFAKESTESPEFQCMPGIKSPHAHGSILPQQPIRLLNASPLSHNMDLKYLAGADPELILLNIQFEELQRIPLSDMSRDEINQLMQELGFYRKETPDSPVPEAFQMAPANSLPPDVEAMKSRHRKEKKGAGGSDL